MLHLQRRLAEARKEDGFTLIELAVVILIIGILLAVAIPTFLGVRKNAQNKAAQSTVRNAAIAAKAWASDNGSYQGLDHTILGGEAPEVTVNDKASANQQQVGFALSSDYTVILVTKSRAGTCYFLRDNIDDSGTVAKLQYGKTTAAACSTDDTVVWSNKW